jgi:rhamnosyltransferase
LTSVTVALPVLNGGPLLDEVLAAVRAQKVDASVELLIADSGSSDGSVSVARSHGASVFEVAPGAFSHGGTRNELAQRASGEFVAFLTQDSTPASDGWLAALLGGFARADRVGLVYGPYIPRPDAPHWIRREYAEFFSDSPVVESPPGSYMPFFTDANALVLKAALDEVPFRPVSYAEDQMLARDMLDAGWSKAYEPAAAVIHSHAYGWREQFGRHFDEFRALNEVHGHVQNASPRAVLGVLRREVAGDRAFLRSEGASDIDRLTLESLRFHGLRSAAALLGTRADRLPGALRSTLSRDGRR